MDRILVLQLKRIGDLVLTAPLTAALRGAFPDAHIGLVTRGAANAVAPLLPGIDQCLNQRPRKPNLGLWRRLASGRWDVVLDVTGNDRSALMSFVSRARTKVTYERHCRGSKLLNRLYRVQSRASVRDLHTVDYHLALLESLGLENPAEEPALDLAVPEGTDADRLREKLKSTIDGRPLAVVHPGTMAPDKYWIAERWGELIDHLKRDLGYAVALSFGPDTFEQEHVREILAASREGVDYNERMSLGELVVMLNMSSLVVSVDTAAMHMAGALKIPQVALFGPTNPYHWRPRHPGALVVNAGDSGAATEFSPKWEGRQMAELDTAAVIAALGGLHKDPRAEVRAG